MARGAARDDLKIRFQQIGGLWRSAPFVLRITDWKDYPPPVLVIKERLEPESDDGTPGRSRLEECGHISGEALRRVLPIMRVMVEPVCDSAGVPLDLQRFLTKEGLRLRGNLPLDEEVGAKLALLCKLQERVTDLDRVELMARRVTRFSREEALYWLSRTRDFGPDGNRWGLAGMRTMLGGQPKDPGVERMLERLRATA